MLWPSPAPTPTSPGASGPRRSRASSESALCIQVSSGNTTSGNEKVAMLAHCEKKNIFQCYQCWHQVMCPLINLSLWFLFLPLFYDVFYPLNSVFLKKLFLSNSSKSHQCHSQMTFQTSGVSLNYSQRLFYHESSNSWSWALLGSLHSILTTPVQGWNPVVLYVHCIDLLPMTVNWALGKTEITDPQDTPSSGRLTCGPSSSDSVISCWDSQTM